MLIVFELCELSWKELDHLAPPLQGVIKEEAREEETKCFFMTASWDELCNDLGDAMFVSMVLYNAV